MSQELKIIMDRIIIMQQPKRLVYGNDCAYQFIEDFKALVLNKVFIITSPPLLPVIQPLIESLKSKGVYVVIWKDISSEPTTEMLNDALEAYNSSGCNAVVGIGGGSALDVAKLVATLHGSGQDIQSVFGIGKVAGRKTYLACLPTTAGTGSEVSPNAIIYDEIEKLKKGVISPYLVPDASYIDPLLTLTVPPNVTASTGMDALIHCIEGYANLFAHPITDVYSLQGIRLIGANLKRAFENGNDLDARAKMALGSLYGGLCLGPVNTGAVHALSYPLGSDFHTPHGIANSLLLPYIFEYNLSAMPDRYAHIAIALGAETADSDIETAKLGLNIIIKLCHDCKIPLKLSEIGVPFDAIERMAKAAMTVTRLLKNNPIQLELKDVLEIYKKAY
jgi:alcohol dehydrogenase class IV